MASAPNPLEEAAQELVTDTATLMKWRWYHPFDSRRSAGGYPDLTLVRDRVIFAELKRKGEKPRADQVEWLDALAKGGAEVYLWQLSDYEEIKRVLSRSLTFGVTSAGSPHLLDADRLWIPGSLWIPGHGRSDA